MMIVQRGDFMNPNYNQNYTKEDIENILCIIKECIECNKYTISFNQNRRENIAFVNDYNIRSDKQKRILLNIKVDDFCHSLQNTNVGYEHEVLYVFVPQVSLYNIDDVEEVVDIYTKFNIIDYGETNRTIVISFHKCNKEIDYAFRQSNYIDDVYFKIGKCK